MLQLKRKFVRYVSHEIRSPLNVVHAGLELLRAEIEAAGVAQSVLDLLKDIYFASDTAIEILNEMLQFEHMDSGTFKLDCSVLQLLNCFENRLNNYKFMAARKDIDLQIEDFAQVASEVSICDQQDGRRAQLVLFVDKFRVEQIVRNLMTNAIKFTPDGGKITLRFLLIKEGAKALSSDALRLVVPSHISASLSSSNYSLRIEVEDSGAG